MITITTEYILILAIIVQFFVIGYNYIKYQKLLDEKNVKLIQFYLDMKFIWKGVFASLTIGDSAKFCLQLKNDIKEYFNLEDVIIIDSLRMINRKDKTILGSQIIDYIVNHLDFIERKLKIENFVKVNVPLNNIELVLHLSVITPQTVDFGIVVCVEKSPSLLSEHELISLEASINLLKTRLL